MHINHFTDIEFQKFDLIKQSYVQFKQIHKNLNTNFNPSKEKFLQDGLWIALNRTALNLKTCKGYVYNRLFKWTEELNIEHLLKKNTNKSQFFDYSLYLLEDAVPMIQRKKMGEHYTSPQIVDFIISKSLRKDHQIILDPAVGSGAFLKGWFRYCLKHKPQNHITFVGYDINPVALAVSELNTQSFFDNYPRMKYKINVQLQIKDSLKEFMNYTDQLTLGQNRHAFDSVIGNPPYIRIQNIQPKEKRDMYRVNYPEAAIGRFDSYMLFIEMAGRLLKHKGSLGYIISNKLLTSNAAKGVRRFLSKNFNLQYLIDLGDSKLFQAAVLPLIIIGSKEHTKTKQKVICANLKEINKKSADQKLNVKDKYPLNSLDDMKESEVQVCSFQDQSKKSYLCSIEKFSMKNYTFKESSWHLNNPVTDALIEKIKKAGSNLENFCLTISAGIKSTADDVFCNPITNQFIDKRSLEKKFIHPYLQAKNINKWNIKWSGNIEKKDTYLIYPHLEKNGRIIPIDLKAVPNIAQWLKENKQRLLSRKYVLEAGRKWYEIWVPQKASYFESPFKIITPDFSTYNRFALDDQKYWCGGNAFMIIPKNQQRKWILYLLGLINSSVIEYFHKKASSTFIYAGRYRYTATAIKKYPIIKPSQAQIDDISKLVEKLILDCKNNTLFQELDNKFFKFYHLTKSEVKEIKKQIKV